FIRIYIINIKHIQFPEKGIIYFQVLGNFKIFLIAVKAVKTQTGNYHNQRSYPKFFPIHIFSFYYLNEIQSDKYLSKRTKIKILHDIGQLSLHCVKLKYINPQSYRLNDS